MSTNNMYENSNENIKAIPSTSEKEEETIVAVQDSEKIVEEKDNQIKCKVNQSDDAGGNSNHKIDTLEEKVVEPSISDNLTINKINEESTTENKAVESIKNGTENIVEPDSQQVKLSDDRNETRVISLDTIIRKGLNEQMPMTAKDIDNIVPNAIRQQQDANSKQSEKVTPENEMNLVYDTSDDDYDDFSEAEKCEDDVIQAEVDVMNETSMEKEINVETSETGVVELTVANVNYNLPQPTVPESSISEDKVLGKDIELDVDVEGLNQNSSESDDVTSDQSFDNFSSETDTTHSSQKKKKCPRKSAKLTKVNDDVSKISGDIAQEPIDASGRQLNRRGKPRKSYDETDNEQLTKKAGKKLKIQRYHGPKRPPGRPKRDDGLSCYKDLHPKSSSSGTTPMDELMALGHSLFSEFVPKKPGRPKRENFLNELNPDIEMDSTTDIAADNIVRVHHNLEEQPTHPQLMFKRKPGRPKIDKESGGHIVFQNSELTVVNKPTKIKGEVIDPQDENGISIVHSKDISIVPIIKSVSTNKDLNRSFNLPVETTITSYGHDRPYQDPNIRNLKTDPSYIEDAMYPAAPLDEMLEVHHVEEYIPEIYDGPEGRRRGRKPNTERSTYSEMTLSEPYVLNSDRSTNKSTNGPSITVKKIEDLLEIPIRKPTLQDFSYPELTVSKTNKSPSNSNNRLDSAASQLAHRAINKRIRGNRMSGSQPTYAELSESSNDIPDNSERTRTQPKKIHWKQQKKIKAAMKPHWTTQWKANIINAKKEKAKNGNIDEKKNVSIAVEATSSTVDTLNDQIPVGPETPIGSSTPKTEGHKEFNESVKELIQTRQKRIPKLKYSSYDFKVRRDPNKPKMVLKFKKKYYKKKKNFVTNPATTHIGTGTSNYEPASKTLSETETPIKVYKKPGPKPKPKILTPNQSTTSNKFLHEPAPTTSKEPERVKRKYVRKSTLLTVEAQNDPAMVPVVSDGADELQNMKIKLADTSLNASSIEPTTKKFKINQFDESSDQSPNKIYLENYNKVLQDRNDVLLEILEQRSAEIRSLKMRVSNMTKSDVEPRSVEKKENIEESWSPAELSKAYSLQKLSKSFYSYVQDRFSLPLPMSIDIDRFIDGVTVTRGLLTGMMQILEFDGETMSEVNRVCVLQISQLNVQSLYEYDDNMDNIIGPHTSMTVVVAKALYSDWSQAVYLNFDVTAIKPILNMIIEELNKIKFTVVACVCKYVDSEPSIWNEYGIGMGCNYFSHPVTGDFIYTFFYIDDLMLSTRNNFVENGFMTETCRINMSPLVELIEKHDLRFPIKSETLTTKCQNISNIVGLFSKQTATLLRILMPGNELAASLADFCTVLSSFYQLMTTEKGDDDSLAKQPYGKNLEYQNDILNETQLHFYRLRCPGATKMSDFQRATMMCIESLKMLQHSTKQKYKMDFFATRNLTREYLKKRINQSLTRSNESIDILSPLKSIGVIKDIFLQAKSTDSLLFETTAKIFLDDEINTALPESHYVDLLINWIADKHEKKEANNDEFSQKMHKFEEIFQSLQNPHFKIVENSVTKVFKKLKSHTFGMFLEVIHKFVVQRHLLRIKYLNAVSSNNMVKPE